MDKSVGIIAEVAVVALIVIVSRWLFRAKGDGTPKARGDSKVYPIMWQWRVVGLSSAAFCALLCTESIRDLPSTRGWAIFIVFAALMCSGIWLASGSVVTDAQGITRRVLWFSSSLRWEEVSDIILLKKQGRAIELHAGTRKITVDSRFSAMQFLLREVVAHTNLQPRVA